MREVDGIRFLPAVGEGILPWLDALASLRIEVFREWPYLYEGDLDYERDYLRTYARSPRALCTLALAGDDVVGAATAVPLAEEPEEVQHPLRAAGIDPAQVFYFGESVLRPAWRGRGVGVRFMEEREAAALHGGFAWCAFCAVQRNARDPRRPPGHRPLDTFWQGRGFVRRPDLTCHFSWREMGEASESPKTMIFWLRPTGAQTAAGSGR